jgi:peroxiredoxin
MTLTPSTMMPLGTDAPGFALPDLKTGNTMRLATFSGKKALLVMFVCRHCPYVKHVENELAALGSDYAGTDLGIVAISANDADNYPDDAPASLKEYSESMGFNFPFCYDESQSIAKAYTAACTPDFFLFDSDKKLVYRGQLDNSRPGNDVPVTGQDLRAAIDAVLADEPCNTDQKPSMGCNIKWKSSPDYAS